MACVAEELPRVADPDEVVQHERLENVALEPDAVAAVVADDVALIGAGVPEIDLVERVAPVVDQVDAVATVAQGEGRGAIQPDDVALDVRAVGLVGVEPQTVSVVARQQVAGVQAELALVAQHAVADVGQRGDAVQIRAEVAVLQQTPVAGPDDAGARGVAQVDACDRDVVRLDLQQAVACAPGHREGGAVDRH